jgi:hypothetical protein
VWICHISFKYIPLVFYTPVNHQILHCTLLIGQYDPLPNWDNQSHFVNVRKIIDWSITDGPDWTTKSANHHQPKMSEEDTKKRKLEETKEEKPKVVETEDQEEEEEWSDDSEDEEDSGDEDFAPQKKQKKGNSVFNLIF